MELTLEPVEPAPIARAGRFQLHAAFVEFLRYVLAVLLPILLFPPG